jgi:[ribosomal protein S5]-alanine N-acetyltransferase
MMIRNNLSPDIELVPFADMRDNAVLKADYLSWLNDFDVVRSICSPALLVPKGPKFVEESFKRFSRPDCCGFFIRFASDDAFIGTAKLDGISEYTHSAWDGIMIGDRSYYGRGLAPKVYKILLAYAFNILKLRRVSGGCNERNIPMVKTFQRIGYTLEGRLRQADCLDGEYSDHLYFGILSEEFRNANDIKLIIEDKKGEINEILH